MNSLPPGVSPQQKTQGQLTVKAIQVIWLTVMPKEEARLLLKFWGESTKDHKIIRPSRDSSHTHLSHSATYNLKAQPLQIKQYLTDMKAIKVHVLNQASQVTAITQFNTYSLPFHQQNDSLFPPTTLTLPLYDQTNNKVGDIILLITNLFQEIAVLNKASAIFKLNTFQQKEEDLLVGNDILQSVMDEHQSDKDKQIQRLQQQLEQLEQQTYIDKQQNQQIQQIQQQIQQQKQSQYQQQQQYQQLQQQKEKEKENDKTQEDQVQEKKDKRVEQEQMDRDYENKKRIGELLKKGEEFKQQMEMLDHQIKDESILADDQQQTVNPHLQQIQNNLNDIYKVGQTVYNPTHEQLTTLQKDKLKTDNMMLMDIPQQNKPVIKIKKEKKKKKEKKEKKEKNQEMDVLQMYLQIDNGHLEEKMDSFIRHRIYDSSERIESNHSYNTDSPQYNHQQSMSVTPQSLSKMNRVPFLLELWRLQSGAALSKAQNQPSQLLATLPLDLKPIPQFYQANNAYHSNKYPFILYDQFVDIHDFSQLFVGQLKIFLAIGTYNQINTFIKNQKLNQQNTVQQIVAPVVQPQMQKQPSIKEQVQNIIKNPFELATNINQTEKIEQDKNYVHPIKTYLSIMHNIHTNWDKPSIQETFQQIMNEQDNLITQKQLQSLMLSLSYKEEDQHLQLLNQKELEDLLVNDKGHYQVKELKQSYKKYFMKFESLQRYLKQELNFIQKTLGDQLKTVIDKIQNESEINYIHKDKLQNIFTEFKIKTNIHLFFKYNKNLIIEKQVVNALKNQDEMLIMNFQENIYYVLKDLLKSKLQDVFIDDLFIDFVNIRKQSIIKLKDLKRIFRQISEDISELEVLLLLQLIKKEYLENDLNINEGYYNQIIIYLKKIQETGYICDAGPVIVDKIDNEFEEDKELEDLAILLNDKKKDDQQLEMMQQQTKLMEQQENNLREQMNDLKEGLTYQYKKMLNEKDQQHLQATTKLQGQVEYLVETQREQERREEERQLKEVEIQEQKEEEKRNKEMEQKEEEQLIDKKRDIRIEVSMVCLSATQQIRGVDNNDHVQLRYQLQEKRQVESQVLIWDHLNDTYPLQVQSSHVLSLNKREQLQQVMQPISVRLYNITQQQQIGSLLIPYELIGNYQDTLEGRQGSQDKSVKQTFIISDSIGVQCKVQVKSVIQWIDRENEQEASKEEIYYRSTQLVKQLPMINHIGISIVLIDTSYEDTQKTIEYSANIHSQQVIGQSVIVQARQKVLEGTVRLPLDQQLLDYLQHGNINIQVHSEQTLLAEGYLDIIHVLTEGSLSQQISLSSPKGHPLFRIQVDLSLNPHPTLTTTPTPHNPPPDYHINLVLDLKQVIGLPPIPHLQLDTIYDGQTVYQQKTPQNTIDGHLVIDQRVVLPIDQGSSSIQIIIRQKHDLMSTSILAMASLDVSSLICHKVGFSSIGLLTLNPDYQITPIRILVNILVVQVRPNDDTGQQLMTRIINSRVTMPHCSLGEAMHSLHSSLSQQHNMSHFQITQIMSFLSGLTPSQLVNLFAHLDVHHQRTDLLNNHDPRLMAFINECQQQDIGGTGLLPYQTYMDIHQYYFQHQAIDILKVYLRTNVDPYKVDIHQQNYNQLQYFDYILLLNTLKKQQPKQQQQQQQQQMDDQQEQQQQPQQIDDQQEQPIYQDLDKDLSQTVLDNFQQTLNEMDQNLLQDTVNNNSNNIIKENPYIDNHIDKDIQEDSIDESEQIQENKVIEIDRNKDLKKKYEQLYDNKDDKEMRRIQNIMNQDYSKAKKFYDFSSDSDF